MKTNLKQNSSSKSDISCTKRIVPLDTLTSIHKEKSDSLSDISHEIRTPMSAIVGLINVLLITKLNDRQKECLTLMKGSAEALMEMINNMLDIGTIEAGLGDRKDAPFSMVELLNQVVGVMSIKTQEKGIALDLHYETGSSKTFVGDSGSIRQIILNLIGNAIKFTERGSVMVSCRAGEEEKDGDENGKKQVSISVTDTGIGIPSDKIGVIFERFTQADPSIMRKYGGTGLGLAISKALAENMGGAITVTSVIDQGSVFVLTLPLPEAPCDSANYNRRNIIYLDTATNNHLMNVK